MLLAGVGRYATAKGASSGYDDSHDFHPIIFWNLHRADWCTTTYTWSPSSMAVPGEIRIALIVRMGKGLVPVSGTTFEEDDQVYVVIHRSAVERFQKMMGWKS